MVGLVVYIFLGVGEKIVRAQEGTGLELSDVETILDRALRNYLGYSYVQRLQLMIQVTSRHHLKRTIDIAHERRDEKSKWLVHFREPDYLRGTRILAIEHDERETDYFLFAPELGSIRRISGAHRTDRVAGTDFTLEDLEARRVTDFDVASWKFGEEADRPCINVEATPRYESRYDRIEWCIDTDLEVFVVARYRDVDGHVLKTLEIEPSSIRRLGEYSIPHKIRMRDERQSTETNAVMLDVVLDPSFPLQIFSSMYFEKRGEVPFLPH